MDPHEHVLLVVDIAADHGDMLFAVEERLVDIAGEIAPLRGDARLGHELDQLLVLTPVADERGDGDEQKAMGGAELDEIGDAGHGAVVVHDLAQHTARCEPGHAGEVDGRLGVTGPLEHATLGVAPREDVTGPGEISGAGVGSDERLDGGGAIGSRDPGAGAVAIVDAEGERGALRLGVVAHHEGDLELVEPLTGERRADDARGVTHEECAGLWRGRLGGHDEIALVLAVLVVDDHDDLAAGDRCDSLRDGGEMLGVVGTVGLGHQDSWFDSGMARATRSAS